jgi:hypothetical protein
LAWQIGALVLLGLWFLYMVTINPIVYVIKYLYSLYKWRGHRELDEATVLSLINAYSDRISDGALKAFVSEQGEFAGYNFAIRPAFHPAKAIVVLVSGYDRMTITNRKP